ncbi:COG1361 S-layer family protein [Haloglomus litoreum]|uniref:COG1361 S-layer family protein n=1 Tax=Haloglomus litoreum TaxID=3034026 RepID=UPI0023E811AB|nr:hypothetical protein [Haloglomus sp. DT116]
MRTTAVALVVALVVTGAGALALGGAPAVGAQTDGTVLGSPSLSVSAADNRLGAGEERSLEVTVANAGTLVQGGPAQFEDRVTTARSVRIEVARDRLQAPLARGLHVDTGTVLLGEIPGATTRAVDLSLGVRRSVPPGTYQLPLRISYEYTSFVRYGEGAPEYNDAERTVVLRVPVVVEERPRLELTSTGSDPITPGNTGRYRFTVTNTGSERATDVGLRIRADNVAVHLGGRASAGETTGVFVGDLDPGASRTVAVTLGAYESTAPGTYLLEMAAIYRTPGGFERRDDSLRAGVRVVEQADSGNRTRQVVGSTSFPPPDNGTVSP